MKTKSPSPRVAAAAAASGEASGEASFVSASEGSPAKKAFGLKGLVAAAVQQSRPPERLRLKHAWPDPSSHAAEISRRTSLLKLALSEREGKIDKGTAANEFREYCRLLGVRSGRALSYLELDKAWRRIDDKNYIDLTFRYAVAAREPKSNGCAEVLLDASRVMSDPDKEGASLILPSRG